MAIDGQVSYSITEEMAKGSLIGNIAHDLGLDLKRLKSGNARIYTGDGAEYIELNRERGFLLTKERIDRESLCGEASPCALHFQIILENPIEFYRITVEITDINDNSPTFTNTEMRFEISESAITGATFLLERAFDQDIGINGLQSYTLKPTDNFNLKVNDLPDGSKNVEMILQKPLDREKQDQMRLLLTAMDGGDPPMSGTIQIYITVIDANDNAPVFTQAVYKATVTENSPKGTVLTTVTATDLDDGSYGKVVYSISNARKNWAELFQIDEANGEIKVIGKIDYEKDKYFQIDIQARDQGGLSNSCKVVVEVIDANDNSPLIGVMSMVDFLPENTEPGTVVTVINVQDPDSHSNGQVQCAVNHNVPFTIKSTSDNFFSLVTENALDRETESEYNITVICSDSGVPSLSSNVTIRLKISDVNDNAPVFQKRKYE
ncbi:protocadherin beta-16-like, partial [Scleropages formosus]